MLKLNPNPTFADDVEITVPGQKEPGTISLTFKYRSRKEFSEFMDWMGEKLDKDGNVVAPGASVSAAFPEFVIGWDLPEEYTLENVAIFLNNYPAAYGEIFAHYCRSLFESRIKN